MREVSGMIYSDKEWLQIKEILKARRESKEGGDY